jgi:hypothetical protein
MTVDAESKAQPKVVTLGPVIDGLRVVDGLSAGDSVIVNGLMRVRPGMKVAPQEAAPASASAQAQPVTTN